MCRASDSQRVYQQKIREALKKLDISTMDVANVTSMFQILYHLDIEYIDFTVWNLNSSSCLLSLPIALGQQHKHNTAVYIRLLLFLKA